MPLCADGAAAAGACPATSRIGTATVAAGAGSEPFSLSGPVYLTGPYNGGPYGLAVVVRALAGPYDLGTVVVRAAIRVDRRDAHLTVDSDALPTILRGIPLRLRQVDVSIDRPGFLLNPTSCGPKTVPSSIRAVDGTTAHARRAGVGERLRQARVHADARGRSPPGARPAIAAAASS